jgi:hypothetical protein
MSGFRTFSLDQTSGPEPWITGAGLGAVIGAVVPFVAWTAETSLHTPEEVLVAPSPALIVTALVPVVAAAFGAWIAATRAALRHSRDELASKAASLLEEAWELRARVEEPASPTLSPPRTPAVSTPRPPADPLVHVQARLLASFGDATRDTARRMHVSLQGLRLTGASPMQERMLDALHGHLEGLWDLADEVVAYAAGDPTVSEEATPRPERPPRVAA